jgi:GNAT superfamily N-acetyltransferase
MAIELESLLADAGPAPQLEVARTDDLKVVAQPLSAGYGFPSEFLTRGLPGLLEHCEAWVAWVDRAPAAGLLLVGEGDDVGVFMVATAPEQRGRGAAALALSTALASCRERGFETSTLQASAMGRSVYARMGYRELGAYELWEWRPART